MAARSPHIRMRDVSRVYDALELGIIIADGNGQSSGETGITAVSPNLISGIISVRMCERSPSVKMLYCLQNGT